jgi:hypothetical protein
MERVPGAILNWLDLEEEAFVRTFFSSTLFDRQKVSDNKRWTITAREE